MLRDTEQKSSDHYGRVQDRTARPTGRASAAVLRSAKHGVFIFGGQTKVLGTFNGRRRHNMISLMDLWHFDGGKFELVPPNIEVGGMEEITVSFSIYQSALRLHPRLLKERHCLVQTAAT